MTSQSLTTITNHSSSNNTERLDRFFSLQSGHYWTCTTNYQSIKSGTTLLIAGIDYIDDIPHTIILHPHPNAIFQSETKILTRQFIDHFAFEPNAEAIRAAEMAAIQNRIETLQKELVTAQSDASIINNHVLVELEKKGLNTDTLIEPIPSDINNYLTPALTQSRVEHIKSSIKTQHEVAKIKADWLANKSSEIANTIKLLTPFYIEKGACATASIQDACEMIDKTMTGVENLDLYVGTNVEVITLRTGASAPSNEPVTIMQRVLFADEELCTIQNTFSLRGFEIGVFFDALASSDKLINQVLPSPRCVVAIAASNGQYSNRAHDIEFDKKTYILIRDGENIHCIDSPIYSHDRIQRLFPSKSEHDRIFSHFGEDISFNDTRYTSSVKKLDAVSTHYKRLLILLCGLDHRLNLFGDFYDKNDFSKFMKPSFQSEYFRFIFDDENEKLVSSSDNESDFDFKKWLSKNNEKLFSGAEVAFIPTTCINDLSAPSLVEVQYTSYSNKIYHKFEYFDDIVLGKVYKQGGDFRVKLKAKIKYHDHVAEKSFSISSFNEHNKYNDFGFINLSILSPNELQSIIDNRNYRRELGAKTISLIRFALDSILERDATESANIQRLKDHAIKSGCTHSEAITIVNSAICCWRVFNSGAHFNNSADNDSFNQVKSIIDFYAAGEDYLISIIEGITGRKPLAIYATGNGCLICLFEASSQDDRCSFLTPSNWVERSVFSLNKKGFSLRSTSVVNGQYSPFNEIPLYVSRQMDDIKSIKNPFRNITEQKEYELADGKFRANFKKSFFELTRQHTIDETKALFTELDNIRHNIRSTFVVEPFYYIPAQAFLGYSGKPYVACITISSAAKVLVSTCEDSQLKDSLIDYFSSRYEGKNWMIGVLTNEKPDFDLVAVPLNLLTESNIAVPSSWQDKSYKLNPEKLGEEFAELKALTANHLQKIK